MEKDMEKQTFSLKDFIPQAVILDNGEWCAMETVKEWVSKAAYTVCCDGAAEKAFASGISPNAIVGDGDSLSHAMKSRYADILHLLGEQDYNDQTKAVRFLKSKGMKRIAILGATGKREDHALGNISLLIYYLQHGIMAVMPTDYGVFVPCMDCTRFTVEKGQQVSVFNFNATGMKSKNLKYECYDFDMLWQGTLNEATANEVEISAKGFYLVYIAKAVKGKEA